MVRRVTRLGMHWMLALASVAPQARAEPTGRLVYLREPGTETCPDEAALRSAVAKRLGEDPFDPTLPKTFRLTLRSEGPRLRGSVELFTDGASEGRRELEAEPDACPELVQAMALAVSLTINPNLVVDAPPPPPPVDEEPPIERPKAAMGPVTTLDSPSPRPALDAPPLEKTRKLALTLAAGVLGHGAVGTGPGVAAGGSAVVRAGQARWNVGLEGRVDALSRAGIGRRGTVYSTLVGAVLSPCVRLGHAAGCPLLFLGSLFARSRGVRVERSDHGFFAAAGARLAASTPLGEHLLLEARVDGLYALTPLTIDLDGSPVWHARASGALGVGTIWEFP